MTPEAMLQELPGVLANLNLGDVDACRQWERERFAARRVGPLMRPAARLIAQTRL